jgi:hypothetical protein
MGGFVSKGFDEAKKALSAALSVTKAAGTIATYLSAGLPRAVASACEALKTAAAAGSSKVVGLAKKMFGSSAAAAAVATLDNVAQAILQGVSSSVAAVQEAVAALLNSASKLAATMVAEVKALVKRILSVFHRFAIPTEAKVAIAVIVIAAVLCVALYLALGPGCGLAAFTMMIAPGFGGIMIPRAVFEASPGIYFIILRAAYCVSSVFLLAK